jgi:hypothetical protein
VSIDDTPNRRHTVCACPALLFLERKNTIGFYYPRMYVDIERVVKIPSQRACAATLRQFLSIQPCLPTTNVDISPTLHTDLPHASHRSPNPVSVDISNGKSNRRYISLILSHDVYRSVIHPTVDILFVLTPRLFARKKKGH